MKRPRRKPLWAPRPRTILTAMCCAAAVSDFRAKSQAGFKAEKDLRDAPYDLGYRVGFGVWGLGFRV